jgi:hypothetical protein
MDRIKGNLFLLIFLFTFCESLISQVNDPMLTYERGLSDKKSSFLLDGYVSFLIQGSLNFDAVSQGYNIPNFNYVDNSSSYVLRSNSNILYKVSARLDQDMPSGAHLKLLMNPPRGANAIERILTSIDQVILSNISKGEHSESITYTFWYDVVTSPQAISRRIIFTVHDN